ncbi:unnamed protein product, partial [Closterium sp. NIES-53]
ARKSTIMLALLRLVHSCSGRILIDGLNTATIPLTPLRRNVHVLALPLMLLPPHPTPHHTTIARMHVPEME